MILPKENYDQLIALDSSSRLRNLQTGSGRAISQIGSARDALWRMNGDNTRLTPSKNWYIWGKAFDYSGYRMLLSMVIHYTAMVCVYLGKLYRILLICLITFLGKPLLISFHSRNLCMFVGWRRLRFLSWPVL